MAQPTLTGLELNAGSGGGQVAYDLVGGKIWQAMLVGYSTGDGAGNIVMADTGLPIQNDDTDLKVTLDGEAIVIGAGSAAIGKLAANDDAVYIGDIKFGEAEPNSAAIKAAVEVMDDWDESDRAKVNLVVGQAGVSAGAGAVGANTPRTTLASDDPAVTALQVIDDWDDGADHCEIVGAVSEDSPATRAPVLAAGRYDSSERTTETGDVTTLATSPQGWMMVANQSSYIFDGATRCEIKRFHVVTSTSGATVIAAPTGTNKVRLLSLFAMGLSATAVSMHLETGTTNTDMLGDSTNPIPLDIDGGSGPSGFALAHNPAGWCQSADADEAIKVVLSAAQPVLLMGTYIEVA